MKKMKIIGLALGVLTLVAMAQPAQAACGAPFLISSVNGGSYAYVINPTVTPGAGGDGTDGSTISAAFTGFFWGVGVGDPALGVGADNGTWPALSWMYIYPNYPATVLTTWAASTGIDTCINVMGGLGDRCQATLFQDVDVTTGSGMFALMSTPDEPSSGDYFLDNGGVNITLAAMPKATITASARTGEGTGVDLTVMGPSAADLTGGAYLDAAAPACQGAGAGGTDPLGGLVQGFNLYYQVLGRGAAVPTDFSRAAWTNAGAGPSALGGSQSISIDCSAGNSDIYVAWSMMLDSGFESDLLSNASTRVECGPNLADPDNIRVKPEGRQAPRTRQR